MITVEWIRNLQDNFTEYRVSDRYAIKLDLIERMALDEPITCAADVLQNLHILAFRQSQQHKTAGHPGALQ